MLAEEGIFLSFPEVSAEVTAASAGEETECSHTWNVVEQSVEYMCEIG